ncbi:Permease of the drug/metabolite transporter (DMT) superfamily [Fodinibius roseus]|uniref:Permease of the drug/metabolite transporter (DMT) superfamily n=1 Tax=Fodinibius roseus TaxID=1194090 RepID=A0A1M4YT81_9BACT|nr:EamA family transporter [Fodinibius roseus]SHF08682.1 Permease of the drug/metabolite transporter (DMT) superfamily [Fodinibius roseus]
MTSISNRWIGLLAFGVVYFVWGANFVAIRIAIESIPPFLMAGTRFFVAGIIIYLWIRFRGETRPTFKAALPSVKQGIWLNVLGTGGLVWSEQYIPSGLAAIVLATVPLWMVVFDKERWKKNFNNPYIGAGLGIGVIGVALLSDYNTLGYLSDNRELFYVGLIVLLGGTLCWSWGSLFSKKTNKNVSLPMNLAIQMGTAGFLLYLIGFFFGEHTLLSIFDVTYNSIFALVFLIVFSSIIGYLAYLWLLKEYSPALVGTYAYVHPMVAVFLGWVLADELITIKTTLSLIMILAAVFLIRYAHFQTNFD